MQEVAVYSVFLIIVFCRSRSLQTTILLKVSLNLILCDRCCSRKTKASFSSRSKKYL